MLTRKKMSGSNEKKEKRKKKKKQSWRPIYYDGGAAAALRCMLRGSASAGFIAHSSYQARREKGSGKRRQEEATQSRTYLTNGVEEISRKGFNAAPGAMYPRLPTGNLKKKPLQRQTKDSTLLNQPSDGREDSLKNAP